MMDIHTIKNLFNFIPYLKEDTWYMLGTGILIYIIYIAYLIVFERYYSYQHRPVSIVSPETSIFETLSRLSRDDPLFFEKLSFLIRSHLEKTGIVPDATKKTQKELEQISISQEIKDILKICAYYEYTEQKSTDEQKAEMIDRVKKAL